VFVRLCRCFCILLITSVILFACSFALVEPTEYGLDWDNNWFTIDDTQVYEGGRHFLGLGHTFIIYPKILRTIKMSGDIPTTGDGENDVEVETAEADSESESTGVRPTSVLNARTSDGLQVMLDLSYQYKLMATPEDLTQLWYDYEDQYEAAFVRISRDTLRNVASQFAAFQYFYNRSIISDAMRIALDAELSNHHANVESFQLLNIALPSKFSDAIQATEVARQAIEQAEYQQEVSAIEAKTREKEALSEAEIILLRANATAEGTLLQANADANVLRTRVNSEKQAFKKVKSALELTEHQLMAYIWLKAIQGQDSSAQNVIGVARPDVLGTFS